MQETIEAENGDVLEIRENGKFELVVTRREYRDARGVWRDGARLKLTTWISLDPERRRLREFKETLDRYSALEWYLQNEMPVALRDL